MAVMVAALVVVAIRQQWWMLWLYMLVVKGRRCAWYHPRQRIVVTVMVAAVLSGLLIQCHFECDDAMMRRMVERIERGKARLVQWLQWQ